MSEGLSALRGEAEKEVRRLSRAMYGSAFTDFTSALTGVAGEVAMSTLKAGGKIFKKGHNAKSISSDFAGDMRNLKGVFSDKINPMEEIKMAREMKSDVIKIIHESDEDGVSNIREEVSAVKKEIKSQIVMDAVKTGVNFVPVPVPGGKTATRGVVNDVVGAATSKVFSMAVNGATSAGVKTVMSDDIENTEADNDKSDVNNILKKVREGSINEDTTKVLHDSGQEEGGVKNKLVQINNRMAGAGLVIRNAKESLSQRFSKSRKDNTNSLNLSPA